MSIFAFIVIVVLAVVALGILLLRKPRFLTLYLAVITTLVLSIAALALSDTYDLPSELCAVTAVIVMGSFVLYAIEKK